MKYNCGGLVGHYDNVTINGTNKRTRGNESDNYKKYCNKNVFRMQCFWESITEKAYHSCTQKQQQPQLQPQLQQHFLFSHLLAFSIIINTY